MKLRFAVILTLVLVLFVYVGWKLAESFGLPVTVAVMVVLFSGVLFYRQIHGIHQRSVRLFLVNAVHLEMGFLSFLLTLVVFRDLVFIPLGYVFPEAGVFAFSRTGTSVILVLSVVSLLVGVVIANAGPWVVRVKVPIRNLPPELEGFSIAQLSDMHIGPLTKPKTVRWIVKKVLELNPNVIALTGDIGDGPVSESTDAIHELGALSQKPAYYVTGNHEYYWNGPEWIAAFTKVGLKPLLNSFAVVKAGASRVVMIGTPDPTALMLGSAAGPNVELASNTPLNADDGDSAAPVRVLMAHQPGISSEARAAGIDLQLSGHTHAGQFFPWTLVVKHVHEFSKGLGRTGSTWVYVNQGTGSWGPQVRLGTWTEITLLTLVKES